MNSVQVDAWKASVLPRVDAIRDRVCQLVDEGNVEPVVVSREPSKQEKVSQDRRDGIFVSTPAGRSRRSSGPSDPTLSAVLAWESKVEDAVTALFGTVGEVEDVVVQLGVTVRDGVLPAFPPPLPVVRRSGSGRLVVCVAPSDARRVVLELCGWLRLACVAVVERCRVSGDADRALYVERLTVGLARAVGVAEPRRCVEGCGRVAPVGRGATCGACRKRRHVTGQVA
jgi:hypothetical protein